MLVHHTPTFTCTNGVRLQQTPLHRLNKSPLVVHLVTSVLLSSKYIKYLYSIIGSGISTYTNATEAGESIRPCLHGILKHVPKGYRNYLKVWLGATAGMRLLRYVICTCS